DLRPAAGAGDADCRAAGRDALQLRRLPTLDQGRTLHAAVQPDRPARRLDAGRPDGEWPARWLADRRPGARRSSRAAGDAGLRKRARLDLAAAESPREPGPPAGLGPFRDLSLVCDKTH